MTILPKQISSQICVSLSCHWHSLAVMWLGDVPLVISKNQSFAPKMQFVGPPCTPRTLNSSDPKLTKPPGQLKEAIFWCTITMQKSYWPLPECTSSGMEVKSQIQIKTACSQFCHLPGFWATTHLLLRHPPAFFPPTLPLSHTCKAKKVSISKTNWLKRLWFCSLLLYYDLHSKWEILEWPYFLACTNHPCDYCS